MSEPRLPVATDARPSPPGPRAVAQAALEAARAGVLTPASPIWLHLQADAAVASWLERLQALQLLAELRAAGMRPGSALEHVARRVGRCSRTIRRWLVEET